MNWNVKISSEICPYRIKANLPHHDKCKYLIEYYSQFPNNPNRPESDYNCTEHGCLRRNGNPRT